MRVLRAGEVFILDVAPIFDGYICDIGYTAALGIPVLDGVACAVKLAEVGIKDLTRYAIKPGAPLLPDLFLD